MGTASTTPTVTCWSDSSLKLRMRTSYMQGTYVNAGTLEKRWNIDKYTEKIKQF